MVVQVVGGESPGGRSVTIEDSQGNGETRHTIAAGTARGEGDGCAGRVLIPIACSTSSHPQQNRRYYV
jgi:hypothetical protein